MTLFRKFVARSGAFVGGAGLAIAGTYFPISAAMAQTATTVESFSAWTVLADQDKPHAVCFVTSAPTAKDPPSATRDAPRLYISAWPKDGIKAELSVRMGFPVKTAVPAAARIADVSFALFSAQDRLYVKDATSELKMIEAMKKGADLKIEATSERGTKITDTYSLSGLGQALTKLQDTCR